MKTAQNKSKKTNTKRMGGKNTYMYILLFPAIIATFIFHYLPFLGIGIAFKDYDALAGFFASPWVGLENFKKVLTMPNFTGSIKNTLIYSSVMLFGKFPFPIILALLFNELRNKSFKRVSQTITYFPHFLSWASVCGLVYAMFAIEGPVNDVLVKIFGEGFERKNILMDSSNFLGVMFWTSLWKEVGWSTVIYLAAITGIDSSLYEAAEIDGANRFQQVQHITIPAISETMILLLILGLGGIMSTSFEMVYGLQNVYIQSETEVIGTVVYREGIQSGEYSLATALGLMQGIVSLILVMSANYLSKKTSQVGLW